MITDRKTFVDRKLSTDTAFSICLVCACTQSSPGTLPQDWRLWVLTSWAHIWALTLTKARRSVSIPTHNAMRTEGSSLKRTAARRSLCLQPKAHSVCWQTLQYQSNKTPPNLEFSSLCHLCYVTQAFCFTSSPEKKEEKMLYAKAFLEWNRATW